MATAFVNSPARPGAGVRETPRKFAVTSTGGGMVSKRSLISLVLTTTDQFPSPNLQMDRFIPNRSASNLDFASYNISRDVLDAENAHEIGSPSKVRFLTATCQ